LQIQKAKPGYKLVKSLFGKYEEIPEEWTTEQMKDLIQDMRSGVSRLLSVEDIGYPVLTSGNIQDGRFDPSEKKYWYRKDPQGVDLTEYIVEDNDIILNFINSIEKIGKSCIFQKQDRDWIFTTNVFRIKTKLNKTSQYYFYYLLNSKKVQKQIIGITQPAINQASFSKHFFEKIHVFIPPVPEQQRISSILSRVDDLIKKFDSIIESTKRLKEGMMQQLLTRGIDHKKFKKVKNFFKKEILIPQNWDYPKFSTIVKVNPPTKITKKIVPYIPMDSVNTDNPHVDYFDERSFESYSNLPRFQENDVLFARITPSTENGKTCIIENFSQIGIASSELKVLRPTDKIFPRYLYYYVKSYRIRQFAISQMMGTTGRQRVPDYVFKKDLNIELPPLHEQRQILSILSNMDSKLSKLEREKYKVEILKKGLMQKLLLGKIRFNNLKN